MMTQKIMAMQRLERAAKMHHDATARTTHGGNANGHHRRARTLLDAIGNVKHDEDAQSELLLSEGNDFRDFHKVIDADPNDIKDKKAEDSLNSSRRISDGENQDDQMPGESLPLLGDGNGSSENTTDSELQLRARQILVKSNFKGFREMFDAVSIAKRLSHWLMHSMLLLAIPLFVIAWVLFYYCGNPKPPEFLPGKATLSWCKSHAQ